jgi:hypothetical protein
MQADAKIATLNLIDIDARVSAANAECCGVSGLLVQVFEEGTHGLANIVVSRDIAAKAGQQEPAGIRLGVAVKTKSADVDELVEQAVRS